MWSRRSQRAQGLEDAEVRIEGEIDDIYGGI